MKTLVIQVAATPSEHTFCSLLQVDLSGDII